MKITFVFLFITCSFMIPTFVNACQCVKQLSLDKKSVVDIVVVGEVMRFTPLKEVELRPIDIIKGQVPETIIVTTGESECDYFLPPIVPVVGERYLLYLSNTSGKFSASRCLIPGPIDEKKQEIELIRKLIKQD